MDTRIKRRKPFRVLLYANGWLYRTASFYTMLSAQKYVKKMLEEENARGAETVDVTYDIWHEYFRGHQLWERIVASTNRALR